MIKLVDIVSRASTPLCYVGLIYAIHTLSTATNKLSTHYQLIKSRIVSYL
ncbi:hypothetical protein IX335_000050 [Porphyromonas levii]|nr:hypothetical protein [Porphyromonas levii]MBR8762853.1 hypothetical protein [Porphyromonas levii]